MKFQPAFVVFAGLLLAACDGSTVRDTLGLYRSAPDEYTVVSRPPLSVPPQFGLRPPSATGGVFRADAASNEAEALVTGNGNPYTAYESMRSPGEAVVLTKGGSAADITRAEQQFLQKAGAQNADPNVRDKLAEEYYARITKKESESWFDRLNVLSEDKDPLVDASQEAARIKENTDAGKPVTDGDTPEVGARDRGVLGDLLGL